MKTRVLAKSEYISTYGSVGRGSTSDPETVEVYKKAAALPLVEFLVVEPGPREDINKLRQGLQHRMAVMAKKAGLTSKFRYAVNKDEKHIVIWKEPASKANTTENDKTDPTPPPPTIASKGNGRATREERRSA